MMVRSFSSLFAFCFFSIGPGLHAQTQVDTLKKSDSLFLRIVIPGTDTVLTSLSRHRIGASTLSTAKAFVNDKEVKVYPSGAFVGLVSLAVGPNPLRILVKSETGDSLARDIVFVRSEPPKTSPKDTLTIDSIMMEPSQDMWLNKDDILEVRFKGSPGYEATFDIEDVESGIPMRELSLREAGGLAGIYVGRYKTQERNETRGVPVEFRLRKSFWSSEVAYSRGKLWILPDSLPRVAEVVGRRPFLNAGLGTDRLGGAKLGYIPAGVLVTITGKVAQQYRIRLSESMEGWLPQEFARLLPPDTPIPHSLAGSILATGNDSVDIVTVSLAQKLPFTSDQQVNPNAILVDVYGATSNTNWITHHLSARGIESVKWNQVSADQYRLTITLKHRQHWGYDIDYNGGANLRIRIRRPPVLFSRDSVFAGLTVVVDAGHGGDNNGALGATGIREMELTLSAARHLDSLLTAKGARVVMTRVGDEGPTMTERTEKAVSSGAQILVSIHCNSTGEQADPLSVQGTSTYYRYVGFKPLANIMYDKMLELGLKQFGVVGSFNFALNAPTQLPTVLVETAFLSHPEDEMLLIDGAFRQKIAQQVVKGLEDFFRTYGEIKDNVPPSESVGGKSK
ncbi:MAG: N-acetylmuramoyl-L-alanine amidase [Ignavibacteriales bacterium]|nr:N-acetylmuramoyl-L-alanine amidase [Ignavibacteriales bacterium]